MLIATIRVVAVTNISMVSVGAVIVFGGLGRLFTEGYSRNYTNEIGVGIVAVVMPAFVIDLLLVVLARVLTPWARVGNGPSHLSRVRTNLTKEAAPA